MTCTLTMWNFMHGRLVIETRSICWEFSFSNISFGQERSDAVCEFLEGRWKRLRDKKTPIALDEALLLVQHLDKGNFTMHGSHDLDRLIHDLQYHIAARELLGDM